LKIEQVLAELKKERLRIEKAIAALEPFAKESANVRNKVSKRQKSASRRTEPASSISRKQRKSANIIQFPGAAQRVSSGRSLG
jgi:hypothetical protein